MTLKTAGYNTPHFLNHIYIYSVGHQATLTYFIAGFIFEFLSNIMDIFIYKKNEGFFFIQNLTCNQAKQASNYLPLINIVLY